MGEQPQLAGGSKGKGCARRIDVAALVIAAAISLMLVVGWQLANGRTTGAIAITWAPLPKALLAFVVVFLALAVVLSVAFRLLDHCRGARPAEGGRLWAALARHPFALPLLLIAVSWLPYLVVFAPGSLPWDGVRSMNQFMTDAPLENHHPVLMNALYAGLMSLGRLLGSDDLGVLLIVAVQSVVCAVAFALVVRELVRMGAPRWCAVLALVFFCLCPVWGASAQAAFKDTMFNGVFCLYVLALLRAVCDAARVRTWLGLLGLSALMCLVRNNGVYIVAPSLLALVVCVRRRPRGLTVGLGVLLVTLLVYVGATKVLYPAMGVSMHEDKEMLSVPFQQVARYTIEAPQDVTDAERAAISQVLPYDQLPTLYNPDLADPVKESVLVPGGNMTAEQRGAFFSAWLSMGLRHPGIYVRSFLANTYAYFYPGVLVGEELDRPILSLYIQGEPINTTFDVAYVMPQGVRDAVTGWLRGQYSTPVVSLLYSPATYVLLSLACLAYLTSRRDGRGVLLLVPGVMLFATVLAGPLNGHLRYLLPVAGVLPLVIGVCAAGWGRGAKEEPCKEPRIPVAPIAARRVRSLRDVPEV